MAAQSSTPAGTIALLFTDVEGSTRLAAELGASWPAVLKDHHALVGGAIADEGGFVDGTEGDAFFATFVDAGGAARAAVAALRRCGRIRGLRRSESSGCGWGCTSAMSSGRRPATSGWKCIVQPG